MEIHIQENKALEFSYRGEKVRIEPWGRDALRVRSTMQRGFEGQPGALEDEPPAGAAPILQKSEDGRVSLSNGRITAEVKPPGILTFYRGGKCILREYVRDEGTDSKESRALRIPAREWKGIRGASQYALCVRFESDPEEKIFGMGQYQQLPMNMKGCILDLEQRNTQISVPFAVSSLGYGFLWNNPAVGKVAFGMNCTQWEARSTLTMDYWIAAGDTPKEILRSYTNVTGRPVGFPDDLLGLWQCKLRYRTQEEVLETARRYADQGIALSMIIVDFFHWTMQGDWDFDTRYWPDPKAMTDELHEMGIRVMVSVWPTVDRRSLNYEPMLDRGLLIRTERGSMQTYNFQGDCGVVDAFSEEAREYMWDKCRRAYLDAGFDGFWIDNTEPDLCSYDFDNLRFCDGPALALSNLYPQMLSRGFSEGMKEAGVSGYVNLVRCCWAGSQKIPNVVWSGDIPSTFESFADQIQCGLNMGLAGISWWTTDIGGFMTDDWEDPEFRELLARWFQFAVYSPVLRMHGNRGPYTIAPLDSRNDGGGYLWTGQPNELWSYGDEVFQILHRYWKTRMDMKEYIHGLYVQAHEEGTPLLRTMFFEFPEDAHCWELQDQYMFGQKYLVAPILKLGMRDREVYLPKGKWQLTSNGETYTGPGNVLADAPLEYMPVFERLDA